MEDNRPITNRVNEAVTSGEKCLTRRRWDLLFLPAILVVTALSVTSYEFTGEEKLLTGPLPVLGLWVWLRWTTPLGGTMAIPIPTDPEIGQLFGWGFLHVLVLAFIDEHPANLIAVVVAFFIGVFFIASRWERRLALRKILVKRTDNPSEVAAVSGTGASVESNDSERNR
jgi:hypothetical protein